MTACPHTPSYPDLVSVPPLQEAISLCAIVEDDAKVAKQRALTGLDGNTRIDSAYWAKLSEEQRAAVVAHERAHPLIGMDVDCEGCADKVGGYFMRAWGYCPAVVRSSFAQLNVGDRYSPEGRFDGNIADNASEGAKCAERALAGRGLLGLPAVQTAETLARERLRLTAAVSQGALENLSIPGTIQPAGPGRDVGFPPTAATTIGGTGTASAPLTPIEPTASTVAESGAPTTPATTAADTASTLAGDIVAGVLGEQAREHATKVLIAAGAAAMLAVGLVVLYRRK